jgi:CBS domain-containing protein
VVEEDQMLVSQILKTKSDADVVTVPPSMLVSEGAKMLSEKRIGTLVVSRDGTTPVGILSERDIVRELGRQGGGCLTMTVDKLMTSKLVTCSKDDRADAILQQMTEGRFRHMPVLQDGALVGLISLGDVVKARLEELSMEKNALEGMIMGH